MNLTAPELSHRSPQENQSKSWKKVWPLFVLSLITSHAISTSRAEHTTSYMSYQQTKTFFIYIFWGFFSSFFFVHYSALLHLPPLRFHCADGCWDPTQDRCGDFVPFEGTGSFRPKTVGWAALKGAQVWDIRSLGFSWFLHHKVFMGRWFGGKGS